MEGSWSKDRDAMGAVCAGVCKSYYTKILPRTKFEKRQGLCQNQPAFGRQDFGFWKSHSPSAKRSMAGRKAPTSRLAPSPLASPTGILGEMNEFFTATAASNAAITKQPIPFFCRLVMLDPRQQESASIFQNHPYYRSPERLTCDYDTL